MNYALLVQGILAAIDLAQRVAAAQGMDATELEQYIELRSALREELVKLANRSDDPTEAQALIDRLDSESSVTPAPVAPTNPTPDEVVETDQTEVIEESEADEAETDQDTE